MMVQSRYLDINLNDLLITTRTVQEEMYNQYLGGIGFNARWLFDLIPPGIDALGPENVLIISAGSLVGSNFPTASRTEASAKSPLSGRLGTSNSGMFFGYRLKASGYDGIILRGKAPHPVYILVENDRVEIKEASHLWGLDTFQVMDQIEEEYPGAQVALIGTAGENQVRYASLQNGRSDAWGRTGMGAVMGSKLLKAIVVKTTGRRAVIHDGATIKAINREASGAIKSSPFYGPFKKYGTMNASPVYSRFSALAAHNFTRGNLPEWKTEFDKKKVDELLVKHMACQACFIACGHLVEIKDGKYQGLKVKDMEITPIVTFGAQCGLNLEASIKASEICQRLGMDMVSTGSSVAMAIELYTEGLISVNDVGYQLSWGDEDAVFNLMEDIAQQKGFGKVLALGTREAGRIIGHPSYAMQVKGVEIPMIDPRGRWSTWSMGMLTNPRGGDHLRCRSIVENLRYNHHDAALMWEKFGMGEEEFSRLDMPDKLKQQTIDLTSDLVNIPLMSIWAEDLIQAYNSLGICIRPPVMNRVGPNLLTRAFNAMWGLEINESELMEAAERSFTLMKLFNIREGEKEEESRFPERFYQQVVSGQVLDPKQVERVLQAYYHGRGWDMQTGRPSREKLQQLGLECGEYLV
ncbi:aldehyde ferredoxin oxidoreductase family protein [Syntrophomonas erecta]